ncbi:mediator of RNA polymerase II transcription subunit 12 isoform X1 [Chlorella sorokiniana]|uniref:Mediator of RNA polymerase II transcription subunit 12 isoform X1 n=1 Tax=Chlorella sorokiniana TaxID=3076 RepID=A0A2P6TZG4_CHLSO|nr:mediator of RNA polymerase II transcription subunit 12 isoform X1 [Chlorella sorokiniana]|eukprot:PRW59457.1 mediator of RNA polymerase II transcription subunit 12 isoform X1 [Chlorella sorokiniana]
MAQEPEGTIAGSEQLEEFASLPPDQRVARLTAATRGVLAETALHGRQRYEWRLLLPLLHALVDVVLAEYAPPEDEGPPRPPPPGFENAESLAARLHALLDGFEAAPFTLQRLCEVLLEPRKQYARLDKVTVAIEKLLMVTSTRQPDAPGSLPPPPPLSELRGVNDNPPSPYLDGRPPQVLDPQQHQALLQQQGRLGGLANGLGDSALRGVGPDSDGSTAAVAAAAADAMQLDVAPMTAAAAEAAVAAQAAAAAAANPAPPPITAAEAEVAAEFVHSALADEEGSPPASAAGGSPPAAGGSEAPPTPPEQQPQAGAAEPLAGDVFPHDADCAEDRLTPEVLLHGYRHSEAAAVGLTPQRELALTLTDQPAAFYSAASLAYWRRSLQQQLQGPARLLASKRKAHELFDVPLGNASSSSIRAVGPANGGAAAPASSQPRQLPAPCFPQQSSRGPAGREAAEAWARQQLAAPGAPPLRSLGWGGGSDAGQVPHGFPRTRAFELLAELEVPLPRALWFLRVLALNRTRPASWDGASEAQQRSRQFTEELLAFLESASTALPPGPASATTQPARRPPLPSSATAAKQGVEQPALQAQGSTGALQRHGSMGSTGALQLHGSMGSMARSAAEPGSMPDQWHYGMRLAGHCCAAGLLEAAKVAEWAANSRLLLPLPAATRQQVLTLLSQCLQAAPLAQQQVLALAEQLFKSAEAAGAAAAAATTHGAGKPAAQRQQAELQELQLGLLQAAAGLLALHPAAFVAADEQLVSPLLEPPVASALSAAQHAAGSVADARRRLARALHARVLTWHDAKAMQLLDDQLLGGSSAAEAAAALLKLVSPATEAGAAATGQAGGEAGAEQPAAAPEFAALLEQARQLPAWQQRLLAHALLAEAKAFLASTDSGGGRASRSPSPPAGAPRAMGPDWFLQLLAVLRACCAHREVLSLLATALNLLQRAVAAAVRTATGGGRAGQQGEPLDDALTAAQQLWQQRSAVSPPLLLALLAAHAGSLVASDIAPKLLPMLTGGLWRLQQAAQQQAAERCLSGQRQLAADLLSLPGAPGMQQWLDKMRQEHGAGHWVVAALLQARQAASKAAGGCGGGQQLLQQQGSARLQAWSQRAQQLFTQPAAAANGTNGAGEQQHSLAPLLLASAGSAGGATASALAAVQHSLEPTALPGLVQQLGALKQEQQEEQQQELVQRLLQVSAPAAAALLTDPQQAYTCLHSRPSPASSNGAAPWQLALGLFAAAAGTSASSAPSLLQLSGHDAMVAAAAAITPATARCGWLLLRLLLDERQWQGGHKLAEAERRLAACAAQQAVLRPESAAALAATLCSLSPSAAAGQQLLAEVEALLRPPVVDLAQQTVQPTSRQPSFGAASVSAAPLLDACGQGNAPPLPFGAEQGLVHAALVCLSTGSSGERQHTFAQQLIRQLSALGDALLPQQAQQAPSAADNVWGPPAGQGHTVAAAAAAAAASPAAVQVSVWLRLVLLLPLLPLVYKHRTADASGSLRGQLLRALLRLLAVPAVRANAAQAAAEEAASAGPAVCRPAAAAAAAAEAAGEPLLQRLLHLLRALLVGGWASWMRLEGGKLRDVPPFEHSRQLAADAAALPLPRGLQAAVQAALPLNQQQALANAPSCIGTASGSAGSGLISLDPWLVLEGGADGGSGDGLAASTAAAPQAGSRAVPPWVEGAVKRRRRDLRYWPTPSVTDTPLLSIAEQLQGREDEAQEASSGSQAL